MYVLRPLSQIELNNIFDHNSIKVINYFIKKSIFSQPERRIGQNILPIQIPKEHIEQRVVQALWVEGIWAGSYPVDVIHREEMRWADIKMLSAEVDINGNLTNKDSWETSLAQKFQWTWNELDQLFANSEYERIKREWLEIYVNKLNDVITIQRLEKIYYFILLRWWDKLHILWMEVLIENISNVNVNVNRTTASSVFLDWFINNTLWYLKIYKAKKRLELRLKPKAWHEWNYCLTFDLSAMVDNWEVNILDMVENWENLNHYWLEKANSIFI